jgi:hypothetical protein
MALGSQYFARQRQPPNSVNEFKFTGKLVHFASPLGMCILGSSMSAENKITGIAHFHCATQSFGCLQHRNICATNGVWTLSFINSAASVQLFDVNERSHFIVCVNRDFESFAQYDWEVMPSASSTSIHPIFGVTVALIRTTDIIMARTKAWTVLGITIDCPVLQRKPARRDVVRILQCEK